MNVLTLEWIAKAEGDYASAGREYRARRNPNYDAACFHAQQVAEKYLKAWLQEQAADKDDARLAFRASRAVRDFMRERFDLA